MRNDLLESNYKRLKKVYDENRTIQHDHKNHVLAISELIKEDKNYEALNYIHTYIKFTKNSLNDVKSGNDIVDIIVHSKYVEAKEKNINFIFDVDFLGNVPIRDIDMCALLANLLDNSIEACEKVKENSRDVSLKICKRNEMLVIRITNSIHSNLSKRRDIFKTEKENKQLHGWGMRSIEYVVKKYDGTKRYYIEGNRIEILVIIPI